jgi:hypothetical protein
MKRRVNNASPISATNCTVQFIQHLFLPPHLISIPLHISIFALLRHPKSTFKRDREKRTSGHSSGRNGRRTRKPGCRGTRGWTSHSKRSPSPIQKENLVLVCRLSYGQDPGKEQRSTFITIPVLWIRVILVRIRILLFSSVAFKMPTKNKFFPSFFAWKYIYYLH